MCLKCILDKDAAEDKMATRCICKQSQEQHNRHCPESLEQREIERLKKMLAASQGEVERVCELILKVEIEVRELENIIRKMHTIISGYVAS